MATGGRSLLKMSDEAFDFVCTACTAVNKTLEAVKYCVECSGYCCKACTDAHKNVSILRTHNLLDVHQGKQSSSQQSSVLEFPTERCSIHKGKVLDMYCEYHNVVGCYVCIAKDHKSCQDSHIHSIPDMIDSLFKLSDCKQTHRLLKDMMVSMDTASKSTNAQLQILKKAKNEALGQVSAFQKALESILSKIAESSRKEIEVAYKQIETKILQAKQSFDNISKDLQTTDDKLNKSEGNRAQRFVGTKIAQEKLKEADDEKLKQELQCSTDVDVSFIPDQSLMEYIQALQGIGQVQKHDTYNVQALQGIGQVQKHRKQKHDMYKMKRSRNITIKLSHDSQTCNSLGCCLTQDNQLLVTDVFNKKLKHIDIQKMTVDDYCPLDSTPLGVCCISKHEVAVACVSDHKIQFVSIHNKMTPTRQIKMSHRCYGIAFKDGQLYVTDNDASLYVYDVTGTLLKTITQDNAGDRLFNCSLHVTFNESGERMFVGGWDKGLVCFDGMGNYLSTITDTDLKDAEGVCFDGRGNMFVVGSRSYNVVQFSENGKKLGVVVKQGEGLRCPSSVCFHQGLNRMFVTMENSNVVKMYEPE